MSTYGSEHEIKELKKNVFKRFNKLRILGGLERALGLDETDLKKYLDSWESKMPEPPSNLLNSLHYANNYAPGGFTHA